MLGALGRLPDSIRMIKTGRSRPSLLTTWFHDKKLTRLPGAATEPAVAPRQRPDTTCGADFCSRLADLKDRTIWLGSLFRLQSGISCRNSNSPYVFVRHAERRLQVLVPSDHF